MSTPALPILWNFNTSGNLFAPFPPCRSAENRSIHKIGNKGNKKAQDGDFPSCASAFLFYKFSAVMDMDRDGPLGSLHITGLQRLNDGPVLLIDGVSALYIAGRIFSVPADDPLQGIQKTVQDLVVGQAVEIRVELLAGGTDFG